MIEDSFDNWVFKKLVMKLEEDEDLVDFYPKSSHTLSINTAYAGLLGVLKTVENAEGRPSQYFNK